jgi:mono/diheme cytochrome c family protein
MAPPVPSAPEPASAAPARPPVLVGASDNPMKVFAGAVGLFVVILLVGLVGPSTPIDAPGVRSSAIAFSAQAEAGRDHYRSQGCASCHTQMVRPVIADVGLGLATLNDTNQVLGLRRVGPDLANVGRRLTPEELTAIVTGAGGHPTTGLGGDDLAALVAYLSQSVSGGAR